LAVTTVLAAGTFLSEGATGATAAPQGRIVQVTGYDRVNLMGSGGAVIVKVDGREASAILRAYATLRPSTSTGTCIEALNAFSFKVLSHKGAPPLLTAVEYDCPSPGVVTVREGAGVRNFTEDCELREAVVAALPRGKGEGSRHDLYTRCGT
jgi:hypothetical protein